MFTSIRFSFKLKDGHRILTMTVKPWKTQEQAKAYLIRYCKIPWFAGGVIEDENGEVLYELTPTQTEYFYTPVQSRIAEMVKKYDDIFMPTTNEVFYPALMDPLVNTAFVPQAALG